MSNRPTDAGSNRGGAPAGSGSTSMVSSGLASRCGASMNECTSAPKAGMVSLPARVGNSAFLATGATMNSWSPTVSCWNLSGPVAS